MADGRNETESTSLAELGSSFSQIPRRHRGSSSTTASIQQDYRYAMDPNEVILSMMWGYTADLDAELLPLTSTYVPSLRHSTIPHTVCV